tara:strand:- start:192 stop:464 length:273 start_codon:yes stop_codon:yes gene_type:complete
MVCRAKRKKSIKELQVMSTLTRKEYNKRLQYMITIHQHLLDGGTIEFLNPNTNRWMKEYSLGEFCPHINSDPDWIRLITKEGKLLTASLS